MSTPSGRSYPKRARQSAPAFPPTAASRRPRRSGAPPSRGRVARATEVTIEKLGVAAQKWTKVYRHPMAPTDEVYFGNSPYAAFTIPTWVKVADLSPEERAKYDEQEKKNEETRARWRKELAEKRANEKAGEAVGSGTETTDKSDDEVAESASGDQEAGASSGINESKSTLDGAANVEVDPNNDAGTKEIASEGSEGGEGANDIIGTAQEAVERGKLPQDAGTLSVEPSQQKNESSDKATVDAGLDCKAEKEERMEVAGE